MRNRQLAMRDACCPGMHLEPSGSVVQVTLRLMHESTGVEHKETGHSCCGAQGNWPQLLCVSASTSAVLTSDLNCMGGPAKATATASALVSPPSLLGR